MYLLALVPILVAFVAVALSKRPFESVILGLFSGVVIYGARIGEWNVAALFIDVISE